MPRSLSSLESKLILHLEWEKQPVVTIEDTIRILHCSSDYARKVLSRLARDRWLVPILPGKYEFIPAERGEYAFPDTNPFFIGSQLVPSYYFSFATSAYYHGLTTQASLTVYIATSQGKTRKLIVREKTYQTILQPVDKFFGFSEVNAYGTRVMMAEPEKTILDSLDKPGYAGDIPEVVIMLWRGKNHLNWTQLAEYAIRFKSQSLIQRLGYLTDLLELASHETFRETLLSYLGKSTCYLGQPSRWQTGGTHDPVWRVMVNIPRQVLLAEIEVHS
jgi:predicted transcriptional regulator of viral defense system